MTKAKGLIYVFWVVFVLMFFAGIAIAALDGTIQTFTISAEPSLKNIAVSGVSDGTKMLLTVMKDYIGPSLDRDGAAYRELYAYFLDQNGSTMGNPVLVTQTSKGIFDAGVAYGGGKYLVIWLENVLNDSTNPMPQGTVQTVKGAFVNPDGTVGTPFDIVSGQCYWNADDSGCESSIDVPGAIFGGGKFLVVYEKSTSNTSYVMGKFIDPNTSQIGNEFQISTSQSRLELAQNQMAFDGSRFLVEYNYNDDHDTRILARFVNPQSGPAGNEMVIDDSSYPSDNPSAVMFANEKYLVVWPDEIWDTQTEPETHWWHFYGKFVSTDGTVSQKFPISTTNRGKVAPFIAFDGNKYLVSWTDETNCSPTNNGINCTGTGTDIYGQYVNTDGSLNGSELVITNWEGNEMGGISGLLINGKLFGIVNSGWQISQFMSNEVKGVFLSPSSLTSPISVPTGQNTTKITGADLVNAPVYMGNIATGSGSDMQLALNFPAYTAPVDIYVGLSLPDGIFYMLDSNGNLTTALVPYAINVTAAQTTQIAGAFPVCLSAGPNVPTGTWTVYSLVIPSNGGHINTINWSTDGYDLKYYMFNVNCK